MGVGAGMSRVAGRSAAARICYGLSATSGHACIEDPGQHRRARSEFEKLYAEAPDYEDVAERLGIK